MIEEHARVQQRLGDGRVRVLAARRATCGQCSVEQGCGRASLARLFSGSVAMDLEDTLGLQPGEQVVIGLPEQALLKASMAIYGVPLAAMLALALIADALFAGEAMVMAAAIAGLAAGVLWARGYGRRVAADALFQPVMVRRASSQERRLHPLPELPV